MSKPELRLYAPVLSGSSAFVADVSQRAQGYGRGIRRDGGFAQGDFILTGDLVELEQWFYEYLGFHFVEKSGGYGTWEGLIYEMELTAGSVSRRRSLDLMANKVWTTYIDDTDTVQFSSAAENTKSQSRYGRREELLQLDGFPQAAAEGYRDAYLLEHAWPWPRVSGVGVGRSQEARLEVTVCGYIFTANWRYRTVGDGSLANLSAWLTSLIETDCEYLKVGSIAANTRQVLQTSNLPQRVYDIIQEQVDLGLGEAPARFYVGPGRRANYELVDTTPRYYLRGGRLYTSAGGKAEVDPWTIQPAVVRDLDYPVRKIEYGGWLADARDFYVSEVDVSEAGISLVTSDFARSDLLGNQQRYQQMLERWDEENAQ